MKLRLLYLTIGLVAASFAGVMAAEPSDLVCGPGASAAERVICGTPSLRMADQSLADLAAQVQQRLPEAALVTARQQDWKGRRDRMCAPAMATECLAVAYAERDAYLHVLLAAAPTLPGEPAMAASPGIAAASVQALVASRVIAPAPAARPMVTAPLPFAQEVAGARCGLVSSTALRGIDWSTDPAPFELPRRQWSKPDFAALIQRSRECQAENLDNARNLQAIGLILDRLRADAPDRPVANAFPLAASKAVPEVTGAPRLAMQATSPAQSVMTMAGDDAAQPVALNCGDPALLQDVSFTYQTAMKPSGGLAILRMHDPRPYEDLIQQSYSTTTALQAEYRQLRRFMAPVPQCLVNAETTQGDMVLSYRLYFEGRRSLIEVQRVS
jgi:hypothetical protein